MNVSSYSAFAAGSAALALFCTLGGSPAIAAQSASAGATPQASATQNSGTCPDLAACQEEMNRAARDMQEKLQAEWPKIQAQIADEQQTTAMKAEKMRELADQMRENSGQYRELVAQAEANAAQAVRQATEKMRTARVFTAQETEDEGWLGVEIGEVTAQKAKDLKISSDRGVIVSRVGQDSPAAKAGLKENDVILQYNGENVEGAEQFRRLVRETPPKRTVTLAVSRDGKTQNLSVTLGDRADAERGQMQLPMGNLQSLRFAMPNAKWTSSFASPSVFFMDARTPVLGITAEDLSGQLGAYFGAPKDEGVLVRDVQSASPAAKAGLKAGDVIISANGKPVKTLADLRAQLPARNFENTVTLPLEVIRKGSQTSVSVTIEPPQRPEPPAAMHAAQL